MSLKRAVHDILRNPQVKNSGQIMLYHGSDIDGPSFDPDQLNIRGHNLLELMGEHTYVETIFLLFVGKLPSAAEALTLERFLASVPQSVPGDHPMLQVTRITASTGSSTSRAMSAGYMVESKDLLRKLLGECELDAVGLNSQQQSALYYFALAPLLFLCSLFPEEMHPAARMKGVSYIESIYRAITGDEQPRPEFLRILDAALVAFTAGFGVFPPTVQVPRSSIGSGAPLPQAIAAGYATAGPNHAGACEEAMRFFQTISQSDSAGRSVRSVIENLLADGQLVFGFGHPLFDRDPRPPFLRDLCATLGIASRSLDIYDEAGKVVWEHLAVHPNLDAAGAAVFLTLGFPPAAGTGLFLSSRTVAMAVHSLERKSTKPAFGVKRRIARKILMNTSKEDFEYSPF